MEINRIDMVMNDPQLVRHYSDALENGMRHTQALRDYYLRLAYLHELMDYIEDKVTYTNQIIWTA
jgi:hypothetical protein